MHYRIEDSNNLGTIAQVSTGGSAASTNWISVNEGSGTQLVNVVAGNYNQGSNTVYKTTSTPYLNNNLLSSTETVTINSASLLRIVAGFPYVLSSSQYSSSNLKVYVRIGFPMNLSTSVTGPTMGSVQAYLSPSG
jgi:hypothetical protein